MNKKQILKRIIQEEGSCSWMLDEYSGQNICRLCPMSKQRKKKDGNYYSCFESTVGGCGRDLSEDDMNSIYKERAEQLLVDIILEEELLDVEPDLYESEYDQ